MGVCGERSRMWEESIKQYTKSHLCFTNTSASTAKSSRWTKQKGQNSVAIYNRNKKREGQAVRACSAAREFCSSAICCPVLAAPGLIPPPKFETAPAAPTQVGWGESDKSSMKRSRGYFLTQHWWEMWWGVGGETRRSKFPHLLLSEVLSWHSSCIVLFPLPFPKLAPLRNSFLDRKQWKEIKLLKP